MLNFRLPARLEVPPTVLDLLLDPAAPRPRRDVFARSLDDEVRRLIDQQPMLALRLGRVLGEMLKKYTRLGYVRVSDYSLEELGVGERTVRNYARLASGVLGRPVLRAAFLAGRLSMSHVLLLLNLPPAEDADWSTRAADMSLPELRKALKSRLPASVVQEREGMGVLEVDLDPEPFVDWLRARELACRREGADLVGAAVLERVVSTYLAAAALPEQEPGPFFLPVPAPAPEPVEAVEAARPKEHPRGCACCHAATEDFADAEPAKNLPAELTGLLPHDARKLAVLARELMRARECSKLVQDMVLRRIQQDRLYRELGHRNYRAWLETLGIAGSTGYLGAARDRLLEVHPVLLRAVLEGRLTRSQVDALQPLAGAADLEAWVAYAEDRTWRRLKAAVEVCMAMRAKAPAAWARRGKRPPQEGESLDDLREQAGLSTLEDSLEELRRRLEGVQTSSDSDSSPESPDAGVQTSSDTASPDAAVQTSSGTEAPKMRVRIVYPLSLKPLLAAGHEAACRAAGRELTLAEAFHRFVLFSQVSEEEPDPAARGAKLKALERAGWQCEVPGCRGRCNLQVHHIKYRSHGGPDTLENYVVSCAAHHLRHLHEGRMKVEGEDPLSRIWEIGILDGVPYRTYVDERLVDAWEWDQEGELPDCVCEAVTAYRVEPELARAA
ncbi:MAG: HNH endonuclease signature motif containing protein [bacterium]|nr:HNH endonuclease signature motif containing protein [bacterium]